MNRTARILFVDDEEHLRVLVHDQLTSEGFSVGTADDGDVALECLARETYDVVLLDIRMPRMSGIEVLKKIRQMKLGVRVIMLTAVDDLSVAMEAVKNGAYDYLTKPYDLSRLLSCIRKATESSAR